MSEDSFRHAMTQKRVVLDLPGAAAVAVREGIEYRMDDSGALTMNVYEPPDSGRGARRPAVLLVTGYSDLGARAMLGCRFQEMESFICWARLAAASGMVAITHATGRDPAEDARALLRHVRSNAGALGIAETRIGLWACSGHVPNALSLLIEDGGSSLRCAAFCYGYMLDLGGSAGVAEAAAKFRFANPCAGKSIEDLPARTPLFLARAGRDETPGLNDSLDRFVAAALARDLPVTVANHADAPHAFDLMDDREATRGILRQVLAFLRFHLAAEDGTRVLETERLVLRRLSADDAPFVLELVNDPAWLRFIGDRGVRNIEDAREYIRKGPEESYAKLGFGLYRVEEKGHGVAAGICGLLKRETLEDVDLGFAFLPAFRGRGYAREAAAGVLALARGSFRLARVVAVTDPANEKSIRVLEGLGFRFERMTRLSANDTELRLYAHEG
jgi:ribosomal-protein-alanine N-acetyltransferase